MKNTRLATEYKAKLVDSFGDASGPSPNSKGLLEWLYRSTELYQCYVS